MDNQKVMEEIWKEISGYEGLYEVSNLGRVRSVRKGIILKPGKHNYGYLRVALSNNGIMKGHYVHRLVAEAFIPNTDNLPQVNHKDEDKSNNVVDNLEWCSSKYNINYGNRTKKVIKSKIDSGYWRKELIGLDKKEYERRRWEMDKEKYKERKRENAKRWYIEHKLAQ